MKITLDKKIEFEIKAFDPRGKVLFLKVPNFALTQDAGIAGIQLILDGLKKAGIENVVILPEDVEVEIIEKEVKI